MTTPPFQGTFPQWSPSATYGQSADSVHGHAPPHAPVPPAPAHAPVSVAPLLTAPLWCAQPNESPVEHRAFQAWLMGGYELAPVQVGLHGKGVRGAADAPAPAPQIVTRGDWGAALGMLGCTRVELERLASRWSWHLRGREYWGQVRSIGESSLRADEGVLEYAALARAVDRKWLELASLELDKAIVEARRILPGPGQEQDDRFKARLFDNRQLIALRRADGALEIQRFRAGVLERAAQVEAEERTNWNALGADELEQMRILREKARQAG